MTASLGDRQAGADRRPRRPRRCAARGRGRGLAGQERLPPAAARPGRDHRRGHRRRLPAGRAVRAVAGAQGPATRSRCCRRSGRARSPAPGRAIPLGVDQLGRDLLSRLIYGSRQSLLIGVVSTVLGAAVGMFARRARRRVRRLGGHRGHAVRRHPAVGARPADGHLDLGAAGPEPGVADDRHRGHPGPAVRPAAARLDAGPARPRLRGRGPGARRPTSAGSCSGTCCPTRCRR